MSEPEDEELPRYQGVVMRPGIRVFCDDRDHMAYDCEGTLVAVRRHGNSWEFDIAFDGPNGIVNEPDTMRADQIWPSDTNTEEARAWRAARQLKVFLCHGSEDKSKVRALCASLRAEGHNVWLDEDSLLPGEEWDPAIRRAVRDCHVILVCLSKTSTAKTGYVQKEIRVALDRADEKPEGTTYIIPVRLDDCDPPERLSKWQRVDLFAENGPDRLKQALKRVATDLGLG